MNPITQEAWASIINSLRGSHFRSAKPEDFGLRLVDGVVVPRVPTKEMLEKVGPMDGWDGIPSMADENHVAWYKAMLHASQEGEGNG